MASPLCFYSLWYILSKDCILMPSQVARVRRLLCHFPLSPPAYCVRQIGTCTTMAGSINICGERDVNAQLATISICYIFFCISCYATKSFTGPCCNFPNRQHQSYFEPYSCLPSSCLFRLQANSMFNGQVRLYPKV